jgi:hypothetical protein
MRTAIPPRARVGAIQREILGPKWLIAFLIVQSSAPAYAIAKPLHLDRHTAAKYLQRRTHDRTRPMLQQRQKVLATCGLAELIEHSVSPSLVCS